MACTTGDRISRCGEVTERYVSPSPRDLPELRAGLARWLARTGPVFYAASALVGRQQLPPGMPVRTGAAQVAAQERDRVVGGELYWVSAAMTQLARHAAPGLPSWNLYRHHVPSGCGLMLFEEPMGRYRNSEGRQVEIVAASWGPWDGPGGMWAGGGVALSFYSHPAPVLPRGAFGAGTAGLVPALSLAEALPPILPDNEAGWPFGDLDVLPPRAEGTTVEWARTLRAAWLLMRQPLAEQTTERASRPARRRLARDGLPAPDVRIIHVRRSPHPAAAHAAGDGSSREYSCQWWVNGHWRTYWCGPGRHLREDRWISPTWPGRMASRYAAPSESGCGTDDLSRNRQPGDPCVQDRRRRRSRVVDRRRRRQPRGTAGRGRRLVPDRRSRAARSRRADRRPGRARARGTAAAHLGTVRDHAPGTVHPGRPARPLARGRHASAARPGAGRHPGQ
jgi:hypothetical protein